MVKKFWISDSRFKFIGLILFLMFLIFMLVIFLVGNAISNDPCQLCAEKMGTEITCYSGSGMQRVYFPDFSIVDSMIGE